MNDQLFRNILRLGALFNFGAALMLLFPDTIGSLAQLPPQGSVFYSWALAVIVAVIGVGYAWVSYRPIMSRELVGVGAFGKLGVFITAIICWVRGDVSTQGLTPAFGDLAFAIVFFWWLGSNKTRA